MVVRIVASTQIPRDEAWVGYATRKAELTSSGIRVTEHLLVVGKIINLREARELAVDPSWSTPKKTEL